jgi:hypothetical protein
MARREHREIKPRHQRAEDILCLDSIDVCDEDCVVASGNGGFMELVDSSGT